MAGVAAAPRRRVALHLLCVGTLLVAGSSCNDDDGTLDQVVDAVTAAKYEFSLLTLNVQGINEHWNETRLPWKERYGRIVQWVSNTNARVELIVLEEVWLKMRYFAGGLSPFEYETLFELVTRLNESTGSHYRVAYANSTRTSLGLHQLFAGQAVIYNADRLRNTTSETLGQSETLVPWSDEAIVGAHMRQSHECMETRPEQLSLCSLIDPDGYLTSPFTNASGRWDLVATATRSCFETTPSHGSSCTTSTCRTIPMPTSPTSTLPGTSRAT